MRTGGDDDLSLRDEEMSAAAVPPLSAAGRHNVFVYGSLLADEVVSILLKRVPPSSPAALHGYHRYSIKGRIYPAMLPVENKKVDGKVLLGITDLELDILDTFEDVEYERSTVEISFMDNLQKLQAYTYVWIDKDDPDLEGEWDFNEWRQLHMKDFLEVTIRFMEDYEQPESNAGRLRLEKD